MQADRWKRVQELYEAAIALSPEKRAELLREECPADAGLRDEVESLLAQQADSFLESGPVSAIKTLSPGAKLGNFEMVELIGRGGMGEVYRARDLRLKRDVAIKVLPAGVARDPGRIARFEREALTAGGLNHPNIVAVYEFGRDDDTYWIATELVAGESLAKVIERGPLTVPKALDIATQVAAGLAAAPAGGIVHRDLKPANLMITRDGRVKILDFGLAKQEGKKALGSLAPTQGMSVWGVAMGTPGYMSPEQVRGEETDARTDIFSFGAVLYEVVSGRRAFAGDSSIAVMHAILNDEPVDLPADLPPILESIVRRCLEKEPARRFQSASDLQFALETSSLVRATPVFPPSKARGRVMMACFLAGAAGVAAGAYWLRGYLHPAAPAEQNILRQITFDHGMTADPAISPDGKLLAFASDRAGAGKLDIWVKQIDGGDPVAVTKDAADDYQPTFSPDGARIAFTSERDGGGIYVMPALGGEASLLVPKASQPRFSPDGQYLLYVTGVPTQRVGMGTAGSHLFAMPLQGGSPVELNKGCSIVTSGPIWTPDGRRILFPGMCGGSGDIWAADLSGKGPRPTGWRDYAERFHVEDTWLTGAALQGWLDHPLRLLVHARSGTADFLQSAAASSDGNPGTDPPARVTFGTGAEVQASSAANGRIAIGSLAYEAHIWGVPLDDSGRATGPARQLTTELPAETQPALSDNGQHLVFVSSKSVPPQLYGKDLTTGRLRRLSQDNAWIKMPIAIGLGGSEVLYADISSTPMSLFAVPFAGGVPQKFALSSTSATPSDWARKGNALLLTQHPESSPGHFSIAAADTSNGKVTPLIQDPGHDVFEAHFSPDARWVTFTVLDNSTSRVFIAPFRLAPIPPGEWIPVTGDTAWTDKPRFSNDGRSILFSSDRDGFRCIWAQRLTPAMRPTGDQFAVFHSHGSQLSIRNGPLSEEGMSVGQGLLVFDQTEFKGNIWMLEPSAPSKSR